MSIREFRTVWNSVFRLSLPEGKPGGDDGDVNRLLLSYPAVGLVLGAGMAVLAAMVRQLVFRPVAAGWVGGVMLALALEWLIRWQGFGAVCGCLDVALVKSVRDNEDSEEVKRLVSLVPGGWLAMLMFGIGVAVYSGSFGWLLLTPTLAMTAFADVLYRTDVSGVMKGGEQGRAYPMHWLGGGLTALLVAVTEGGLGPIVLAVLATWGATLASMRLSRWSEGRVKATWLAFALLLQAGLWIGVIFW
jgi:hypothetical protein